MKSLLCHAALLLISAAGARATAPNCYPNGDCKNTCPSDDDVLTTKSCPGSKKCCRYTCEIGNPSNRGCLKGYGNNPPCDGKDWLDTKTCHGNKRCCKFTCNKNNGGQCLDDTDSSCSGGDILGTKICPKGKRCCKKACSADPAGECKPVGSCAGKGKLINRKGCQTGEQCCKFPCDGGPATGMCVNKTVDHRCKGEYRLQARAGCSSGEMCCQIYFNSACHCEYAEATGDEVDNGIIMTRYCLPWPECHFKFIKAFGQ
ncbi:WAP four-disulfide core domain protein 3-like [Lineus longissimus]|uniref:WAP four-disulfide core domain protein 3-like n=1 Tax=Lineus longissimus TaxID=88925 RepID=UPI002B4DCEEB